MNNPDFFSDLDFYEEPPQEQAEGPDFFTDILDEETASPSNIQSPQQQRTLPPKASTPDFLSALEKPSTKAKDVLDYYRPEEKTPQEIKAMSARERKEYAQDLKTYREMAQSRGVTKGLLSGASLGLSEKIPGLAPNEEDFLSGFGEFMGSVLPITKLYNILGKPLVKFVAKTPVAKEGLQALARMTGFGLTGAAYEGAKETIKTGEIPKAPELVKYGAQWAAFDGALQLLGKAAAFIPNMKKYAQTENISEKDALSQIVETLDREKINPAENPEAAIARAEEIIGVGQETPEISNADVKVSPKKMEVEAIEPSSQKVKEAAKEIDSIPVEKRTPQETQIKALSEESQPGDPSEKLFENAPIPDEPSFIQRMKGHILKPKSGVSEKLNELKQDYFSKKWGLEWDSFNKWNRMLKNKEFKPSELSDMMFYVENPEAFGGKKGELGTGNPFVSANDTFEALEKRLTPKAKNAVKDVITPHFKQWVNTINKSGYAKKINPREFLEGVYIPHFYSGDSKKGAKQAVEMLSKRFSTNNPFANMRTFMTYNEALQKAGMKPRFDNIADLMNEYDRVMSRVLINSEFAGKIGELEKEMGSKLIVRSNSKKYADAKKEGWVPFDDPYLRRYVAGADESGKPIFATLETPALVHPDAADAFTGIFIKDAQKPQSGGEMALWKGYDALSDMLKSMHVSLSGFHYLTLAEESAKSSGVNLFKNFMKGGKLLDDPVFMREFVESGGVVGHNPELTKKALSNTMAIEQSLMLAGGPKKLLGDAIKGTKEILQKPSKFLFEEFQPRLKVAAFYDMRSRYLRQLSKKGIAPTQKQMKQINKELASLSNDMFGGQRFELMQNPTKFKALDFNDPSVLKGWKRAGGYVDWTTSAIREFSKTAKGLAEMFPGIEKTPTGTAARQNFWKYARNLFVATQMMNYFTTGLTKDKDGKLTWDANKAHSTFENDDPSKNMLDIQLPDVELDIAGQKFNLGRDDKGRRLHTHFGKKMLEIFHYGEDPIKQLFNKGNPVWQALFVQAAGGTPSMEGIPFKAESAYVRGEQKSWEGKKGWKTLEPRIKHLLKSSMPYSMQSLIDRGLLPGVMQFLATGLGALPISKGMSLDKSAPFYDKYLHNESKYKQEIEDLDRLLKSNGYKESQIKSTKTRIRNLIQEEKESS